MRAKISRKRRRAPSRTRKILRRSRGRVLADAGQIVDELRVGVAVPEQFDKLRSSIQALERQVAGQPGGGPKATLQALRNVDTSLAKLAEARASSDPVQVMSALEAGLRAFDQACREARNAGSDWAL